ncbi:hypothetical protein BTA51_10355 [Hahella sp. CCB-MM4]|uniref:HzsA-related protein n=1 Tax=Hahella sp. (strain CCB-MM4) TaxID=1926491 RepID=UPI000B9AFFA8|nr:hypothetical protein [Hahella sp. CCB-MM4]OZG73419.1 hypothetical protein BTA51_10355 [Hahella sp. CCB-MM4]
MIRLNVLISLAVFFWSLETLAAPVDYDIVYVKQPRHGDSEHINWPEAGFPARVEQGSDLVLLHPDGSEEILVDTENGAVTDPYVSFDGKWVFYSFFPDVRTSSLNSQRDNLPLEGADIYKINLETREIIRLTFQEFTPNTGSGNWNEDNPVNPASIYNSLGYGILNTGPAPIAGNKIVFTSNRNGFKPTKSYTSPTMQLYVMDEDGSNVTAIAPMTLGSALHPTPLKDGRIVFSSYESQGLRDVRLWGLWSIYPDGRHWDPVVSAFGHALVFHFTTQVSDGRIVVEDYYNKNNFGFGSLLTFSDENLYGEPKFFSAIREENPKIEHTVNGNLTNFRMPFTPKGMYALTPSATAFDTSATPGQGKYTHPSAAPGNNLLVVWSDGPVNKLNRPSPFPAVDSGIYMIAGMDTVYDSQQLVLIKNDPEYNEAWPRAVVKYRDIYGVDEPAQIDWLPNTGSVHPELPEGTPYGLIGTSSFLNRETMPGGEVRDDYQFGGLDAFNTSKNNQNTNWNLQGADAGRYTEDDIWAVRIIAMEPFTHKGYGPESHFNRAAFFRNHAGERLRILGEIPLRKFNSDGSLVVDSNGTTDTSFLAKIPADTPFTFQTIDKNGVVLNMAQTWHQVRPGEVRNDCGGCHAHSKPAVDFRNTYAGRPDYQVWDLTKNTPLITKNSDDQPTVKFEPESLVNVEFYQNIRPVLQEKCVGCHNSNAYGGAPAELAFDDTSIIEESFVPVDYARLCDDQSANWGIPPVLRVSNQPLWRQTNASRYVREFQSRRSLLMWKIFGERMDGWSNSDHPTESVAGDPDTLPEGVIANQADLDYTGTIMPPVDSGVAPLTIDEKMTFARWIDLGCPIDTAKGTEREGYGWFLDETRPTLAVTYPAPGNSFYPLTRILVGVADAYTGVNVSSLHITADFEVDGKAPGTELAEGFRQVSDGVYEMTLQNSIYSLSQGTLFVSVRDNQGNVTKMERSFAIKPEGW